MVTDRVEQGIQAAKLAMIAVAGFIAWKVYQHFFGKEETKRTDLIGQPPPVVANDPNQPPPPAQAPPTDNAGVVAGGLSDALTAYITEPAKDGKVTRGLFKSTVPVRLAVINNKLTTQRVQVLIIADFYEFAGAERIGVETRLDDFFLEAGGTSEFETPMNTGNTNGLLYELAQANAIVKVYTNGALTQSTSFQVW